MLPLHPTSNHSSGILIWNVPSPNRLPYSIYPSHLWTLTCIDICLLDKHIICHMFYMIILSKKTFMNASFKWFLHPIYSSNLFILHSACLPNSICIMHDIYLSRYFLPFHTYITLGFTSVSQNWEKHSFVHSTLISFPFTRTFNAPPVFLLGFSFSTTILIELHTLVSKLTVLYHTDW